MTLAVFSLGNRFFTSLSWSLRSHRCICNQHQSRVRAASSSSHNPIPPMGNASPGLGKQYHRVVRVSLWEPQPSTPPPTSPCLCQAVVGWCQDHRYLENALKNLWREGALALHRTWYLVMLLMIWSQLAWSKHISSVLCYLCFLLCSWLMPKYWKQNYLVILAFRMAAVILST